MLATAFKPFFDNPIFQTFDWFAVAAIIAIVTAGFRALLSLRRALRERPVAGTLPHLVARRDAAKAALDRHGSVSAFQIFQTFRLVASASIIGFVMVMMILLGLIASLPRTPESNLFAGLILIVALGFLFLMMWQIMKTVDDTFQVSRDIPRLTDLEAHIALHTASPI